MEVDAEGDADQALFAHSLLRASLKNPFRLHSKAFMLTFNCLQFVASPGLWTTFQKWVEDKAHELRATYWSATMEESEHSEQDGRVHMHCYLSWHGPNAAGIDHTTTDAFVFQKVRPRVGCNTEKRGPYRWLKATQQWHFYTSVYKFGTLYFATNYAPWTGLWAPEEHWIKSLWKQNKLTHDQYLMLGAQFRDRFDRRKQCVDAVVAAEVSSAYAEDKVAARKLIEAAARPFKPLPDAVQAWKRQCEEPLERYQILVLYGPTCTGTSRLARSLFGVDQTLVVDVQHAEHPDLRGFRRSAHKAVLMDEVASLAFIVGNKQVLQAHVDRAIPGRSANQLYTYEVFLWRTPLMLTTNNFTYADFSPSDINWIGTNCVAVFIGAHLGKYYSIIIITFAIQDCPASTGQSHQKRKQPGAQEATLNYNDLICARARKKKKRKKERGTHWEPAGTPPGTGQDRTRNWPR